MVDARDVDVHLAEPLVLLQEGVEDPIEVADEVAVLVQGEDRLRNHVLDLTDAQVLPVLLKNKKYLIPTKLHELVPLFFIRVFHSFSLLFLILIRFPYYFSFLLVILVN